MTKLDEQIKSALETIGVEYLPFALNEDGRILVADLKEKIGCIVRSIGTIELTPQGYFDIKSTFYFCSLISTTESEPVDEINPLTMDILKAIKSFLREVAKFPYPSNPNNQNVQMSSFIGATTAYETGISFELVFRVAISEC